MFYHRLRVCACSGILRSSRSEDPSRPRISLGGGRPAETKPLSICLSPSARRAPSRSRLLHSSVTPVMDEIECDLRPMCMAQDLLWSPALPFACIVTAQPRSGCNETKVFFCITPQTPPHQKNPIQSNDLPGHLGCLNVCSIPVETLVPAILNIAEAFGRRLRRGCKFAVCFSPYLQNSHIYVWQWFKVLNATSERTSSSKKIIRFIHFYHVAPENCNFHACI